MPSKPVVQNLGAALVIGADESSHYEMTRDESFVVADERRRAFMKGVPSYSSSTLNTVASESYCIPEDVLHAAGGTSTPEKKQPVERRRYTDSVTYSGHAQIPPQQQQQQQQTHQSPYTNGLPSARPLEPPPRNLPQSTSTSTLRDSDFDRFEDAEDDGDLDSPDTSAEVSVATVARLAPAHGQRGIFHKSSGIGHGHGLRTPNALPQRPQTHDPRAKAKPANAGGPPGIYARIKMKEAEIERQFELLVRQSVKSKKEGDSRADKPRAASDNISVSSRDSQTSTTTTRADRVAHLQLQSDKLFELSREISVEIDAIKKLGPTTSYKSFSANTGARATNLTDNLAELESKKQAVERELYQVGLLLSRQYIKMREEGASEYWVRSVSK